MANTRPFIWAHRQASGYVPENTMLAFRRAIELGADGVETDASITADDIVVLSYDGKLKLDGMKVDIRSSSFEEIHRMPQYQAIPTYRDLVDLCLPRKMPISGYVRDIPYPPVTWLTRSPLLSLFFISPIQQTINFSILS